ncbi:MAG: AI-2E family transporter [Patescibacteria group bacterium]
MEKKTIANLFLLAILGASLYVVYLFFKPFLMVMLLSAILVSVFYPLYIWTLKKIGGHPGLAALIMVIIIAIVIVLPVIEFLFYLSQASIESLGALTAWINSGALERVVVDSGLLEKINFVDPSVINLRQYVIAMSGDISGFLVSGGASILKGTGQFITSLVIMFFTMFFLFRDGKSLLDRVMHLTPLPNKYDKKIFQKFRDVSYSTMVSTFVTAIIQGVVGAIGFMIVGVPALLAGVVMAFLSLLPYVGAAFVWLPAGIYLLVIGKVWQGIFILIWGGTVVSLIDNILRPLLIRGQAQVHPLLIFFSIFGGILAFGFWGIFIGPIVISIAFTLLQIYEIEYADILER